jgi:hypothetical protein
MSIESGAQVGRWGVEDVLTIREHNADAVTGIRAAPGGALPG